LQLINTEVCKETIHGILLLGTLMNPNHFVVRKILKRFCVPIVQPTRCTCFSNYLFL